MIDVRTLFGSVAIILALVELIKRTLPNYPRELVPLTGVVIGVGFNLVLGYQQQADLFVAALTGLTAGLSAMGLYSGGKATIGN